MSDTPTIFVAFGVTGDLMRLKILPALFSLYIKDELPERFALLGVSRREQSNADLRAHVEVALLEHSVFDGKVQEASDPKLASFLQSIFGIRGDAEDESLYSALADTFDALEHTWGDVADKIVYLSISPKLYRTTFEHLRHASFTQNTKRVRLMIEKPFGTSGKSSEKLQTILQNTFEERALYRVDHFLAKEALASLPQVDGTLVSSIKITFFETGGVEKRGSFYDATGALLDIGQNHMLEILARLTMEHSRAEAIEALRTLSQDEVALQTCRSQADLYLQVAGVAVDSPIETYFKITTTLESTRFKDVTVTLEGGKYMDENKKEVTVTFKDGRVLHHLISENKNRSEYETLIHDCIHGNQTLFVSKRENAALWRFIDPILESWHRGSPSLGQYKAGTRP